MFSLAFRAAAYLALAVVLAACEDDSIADIPFADIQSAAGDAAAFKGYFDGIKGKRVLWQAHVIEARKEFEDDYVATGLLLVDLDGAGEGADATLKIAPSLAETLQPGQAVTLTAVIREYELKDGRLLLRLETKEIQ